ncbi:MAG TPA: M23 family metallopeptidase [Xanthobacteraceae bacterium]|nr:M23 family metallopeptidase [Xanthobacteraceae bacterium]
MAHYSSYGANQPYSRDGFGRRFAERDFAPRGISKAVFTGTLVAAVFFALWAGAATFYLVFRDDILHKLATGQLDAASVQDAQIAALTTEIERLRSTKYVDQEKIEQQLSDLSRVQRMIDARHNALVALSHSVSRNPDITGTIPAAPPRALPAPQAAPENAKPRPLSDTLLVDPPLERSASIQSRVVVPRTAAAAPITNDKRQVQIANVESTLTQLGAQQSNALNALELQLDERMTRTRLAIRELGIRVPAAQRVQASPIGGPFVPFQGVPEDSFMRQVFRVRAAAAEHEKLVKHLDGLPIQLPLDGSVEITSGFGARLDPFLRRLAMHSGIDLRGETGDAVRSTAAGTVVYAARHRAYGLMVEIDHGNGLSTRYAHLSAIHVKEGARVPASALIGKIGSTGRSTGPHLHYEIRVDGEAIDPRRYLRAAKALAGIN